MPLPVIQKLIEEKNIIIAAGGGGIPVYRTSKGMLRGIEAVIDKDYSASLLARELDVDIYINLTGVDSVYVHFGKKKQKPLSVLTVKEAKKYAEAGEFSPGSMGPKVLSAVQFVERSGKEVLITSAGALNQALNGELGTRIVP